MPSVFDLHKGLDYDLKSDVITCMADRPANAGAARGGATPETHMNTPKERPILFSAPMVRALLDGTKTQTRRLVKPQPMLFNGRAGGEWMGWPLTEMGAKMRCPYGNPGDRLWVKEAWAAAATRNKVKPTDLEIGEFIEYRATYDNDSHFVWRPSLFMRRWMSRITLEIVSICVERLQEISREDAIAEGIESRDVSSLSKPLWRDYSGPHPVFGPDPIQSYRSLWESINGPDSWADNPWVWVVEFKRILP